MADAEASSPAWVLSHALQCVHWFVPGHLACGLQQTVRLAQLAFDPETALVTRCRVDNSDNMSASREREPDFGRNQLKL